MIATLEPIIQKSTSDCGVAALAMYLNRPYREVSSAALKVAPRVHKAGLWTTQMKMIAKALHHNLVSVRVTELDDMTGLLTLAAGTKPKEEHVVVLFQGVVIDPSDGLLWDRETYLSHGAWRITGVLV